MTTVQFSQECLALIVPQIRAAVKLRGLPGGGCDARVKRVGSDHWEFCYGTFLWHGPASDAFDARYCGWIAWMRSQDIDIQVPHEAGEVEA
jgi:hypothetical protein